MSPRSQVSQVLQDDSWNVSMPNGDGIKRTTEMWDVSLSLSMDKNEPTGVCWSIMLYGELENWRLTCFAMGSVTRRVTHEFATLDLIPLKVILRLWCNESDREFLLSWKALISIALIRIADRTRFVLTSIVSILLVRSGKTREGPEALRCRRSG